MKERDEKRAIWNERRRWMAGALGLAALGLFGPSAVRGLGPLPHTLRAGDVVSANAPSGGATHGSSSMPASIARPKRLSSIE